MLFTSVTLSFLSAPAVSSCQVAVHRRAGGPRADPAAA